MGGSRMKKYKVQCKYLYADKWWDVDYYNSLKEANERITEEKRNDEQNGVKWKYKYRILIYEIIESEV